MDVVGLTSDVAAVSAGGAYTCAVNTTGGVKCWGLNAFGQLGDGTTANRATPGDVTGLTSGVAAVATGVDHTCAVTSGGGVKCWGLNAFGQLGDGTTTNRTTPVDVGSTAVYATLSIGLTHTCGVATAGFVKCWGRNLFGALGNGDNLDSIIPVFVTGFTAAAPTAIPGVSPWGLVIVASLLVAVRFLGRRRGQHDAEPAGALPAHTRVGDGDE